MNNKTYEHELNQLMVLYDEVCNWFTAIGFEYTRHRYGKYKKRFQDSINLSNNQEIIDNDLLAIKKNFDNAYLEINEIIRVYNSLKHMPTNEFIDQVKKICSGQEFRAKTENDTARDFLFELSIASRFIKAGYTVNLRGVCDVVVDLGNNTKIYIECKRIKSEKQIGKNIKKANSQITNRIKKDLSIKRFGLIALNISDLLHSENHISAIDQPSFTKYHRQLSNDFIHKKRQVLQQKLNKKCFGLMIESARMGYTSKESEKLNLFFSRHTEYLQFTNNVIFEKIIPELSNQDIL